MNILLDTCAFLYAILEPKKLSDLAAELIENPNNSLFLSSISVYEIIVKYKIGKLELKVDPVKLILEYRNMLGILELPVKEKEVLLISSLPNLHQDPFDRILITQAIANNLFILTLDKLINSYPGVRVIW